MNYFILNNSLDTKIVGKYTQADNAKHNCNVWNEPKFIEHVYFEKIDFDPIVSNAIMYPKAKVTDLISVVSIGFTLKLLMSSKLKKILEQYRKTGLQFFASDIIYNNKVISNFWVLNSFEIDMQFVDFKKSKIYSRQRKIEGGTYLQKEDINTYAEFIKRQNDIGVSPSNRIFIDKIYLNDRLNQDFFTLLNVDGGVKYIVSERLKQEIENANCTGIEFQPSELSYNEWLAPGGERERIYGKSW